MRLGAALAGQAVPLQLDIETVAVDRFELLKPCSRKLRLFVDKSVNRPRRTAGQGNQTFCGIREPVRQHTRRFGVRRFHEAARRQTHQVAVAVLRRSQQHEVR